MKTVLFSKQVALVAIVGLLIGFRAVPARAQVPSGNFSYSITNSPLWDPSGTYTNSSIVDGANVDQIADFTASAKGQINGTFDLTIDDGTLTFDVGSVIAGKMSEKGQIVGASVKMEDGTLTGSFTGTAKGSAVMTFDEATRTITNEYKLTLCAKVERRNECKNFKGGVPFAVPMDVTGDWTLDIAITNVVNKLGGTGTLTLSTGRAFTYGITGSYKPTSEIASLKLLGQGDAVGSSLKITTIHGTNMVLNSLSGKVLGQKPTVLP